MARSRMSTIARFLTKTLEDPVSGCWVWQGYTTPQGYGRFWHRGRPVRAHRLAVEMDRGPVADGLQIDHLCRNRSCVNPEHLEVVTQQENVRRGDGGAHNRRKEECPKGHRYSGGNLYLSRGKRYCRTCRAERDRNSRSQHKQVEN